MEGFGTIHTFASPDEWGTDERLPEIFSNLTAGLERLGIGSNPLALLVVITLLALGALILGYIQRREIVRAKEQFTLNLRTQYIIAILGSKWEFSSTFARRSC